MNPKCLRFTFTLAAALAVALFAGCASTPQASDAKTKTVFDLPQERVQKAAQDALVVTGFEIKKQEPNYVEGYRPRKVGVFVGSGGESVGVWLTALAADKTEVKIKTAKTFVGGAGQKNWDSAVLAELTKSLGAAAK